MRADEYFQLSNGSDPGGNHRDTVHQSGNIQRNSRIGLSPVAQLTLAVAAPAFDGTRFSQGTGVLPTGCDRLHSGREPYDIYRRISVKSRCIT
jgi:hypothetical protein